jgi:hypothetical protein
VYRPARRRCDGLELSSGVETSRVVLDIAGTGNDTAVRDFTAVSDVAFTGY